LKRAVFIILFVCLELSGEANIVRHSYDPQAAVRYGAADNARYRLTKQQTGNNSIAFTYDNLGRVQKESRQIDGSASLDFIYDYNSFGQLYTTTYPNNLQVSSVYDVFGNLQTLKTGSQILWELTGATGTVTTEQAGGTVNYTTTLDSKGLLSNLKAATGSTLYNTSYSFDGVCVPLQG